MEIINDLKNEVHNVHNVALDLKNEVHNVSLKQHDLKNEVHNVSLKQHIMNEKFPEIIKVVVTPSEYNKSNHTQSFFDLLSIFGFGRSNIHLNIEDFTGAPPPRSAELNFSFRWKKGQPESDSYDPLLQHLCGNGICAVDVSEGTGLPGSLLFCEELWTLRKNSLPRGAEDLRKPGYTLAFKYILRGRTDIVVKKYAKDPVGKSNNRYFIEIKRVEDFKEEESLREAVLQLIGGNASNSFHSPPVLLTNLAGKHFVLFITLDGDPMVELKFKLNVVKMSSFGVALAFVEERTAEMNSVTLDFGRRPSPLSSPLKGLKSNLDNSDDEGDIVEKFESVTLEEVVADEKGDAL